MKNQKITLATVKLQKSQESFLLLSLTDCEREKEMKIKFLPTGQEIENDPNKTLLQLCTENQIEIRSICKGVPSCAECRVKIVGGEHNVLPPTKAEIGVVGSNYFIDQRRLACQVHCFGEVTVDITEQIERSETQNKKVRGFRAANQKGVVETHAKQGTMVLEEPAEIKPEQKPQQQRPQHNRPQQQQSRSQNQGGQGGDNGGGQHSNQNNNRGGNRNAQNNHQRQDRQANQSQGQNQRDHQSAQGKQAQGRSGQVNQNNNQRNQNPRNNNQNQGPQNNNRNGNQRNNQPNNNRGGGSDSGNGESDPQG